MEPLRLNWILPRPSLAGGIKSNRLLAEAMVRRGHRVTLAYSDAPRPWPSILRPRRFLRRCLQAWRDRGTRSHHLQQSTADLIPVPRRRIQQEDVPDADVTIATWWETREWISDWPPSKGIQVYMIRHHELHGGDPERVKATYRMPGLKVVIAKWLQRVLAEEYGEPDSILVPNGVDWAQFDSTPRGKARTPTVGVVYGPTELKGLGTAFEAIRLAQRTLPELQVIAFGVEPLRAEHAIPKNFEYLRRPSQALIPGLYKKADCWLMPSVSEGFGMPGLEAAACRCPIVATRCGGPEDYVQSGVTGHLVEVGNAEAMAASLLKILSLDDADWRRMSEASYLSAKNFDWDRSAEIFEAALASRIANAPSEHPGP